MKLYGINDGLPSSTIYSVLQAKDGFLWFSTNAGVSRYDGKNFANYNTADGLADNEIISLGEDSKGRIWFLGFNGTLSYYLNGKIYNSADDPILAKAQSANACLEFFEAANGDIWITTLQDYIRIGGSTVTTFNCNTIGIANNGVVMNGNRDGSVYINTQFFVEYECPCTHIINADNSVQYQCLKYNIQRGCRFFYLQNDSVLFRAAEGIVLQKDTIQKLILPIRTSSDFYLNLGIILTNSNKLWISSTNDGILIYDYGDLTKKPEKILEGVTTGKMTEDFEGNIWVAAAEGVYMIPSWHTGIKLYNKASGLPGNKVYSVGKNNDKIYTGFIKSQVGILQSGKVKILSVPGSDADICRVMKIASNGDNTIIGTDFATIHINDKTGCLHDYFYEMKLQYRIGSVKDIYITNDKAYIATSGEISSVDISPPGCYKHTKRISKVIGLRHFCVFAEQGGKVWCGNKFGLYSYENGEETDYSQEHTVLDKRIEDIEQTSDSTLILATYGYGLVFYKNGNVLLNITESDGLSSNICKRIYVYNDEIYVATARGVTKLVYRDGEVVDINQYTTANALPSNDVNDIYADQEGLYVATSEGLVVIERSEAEEKELIPILQLTGVTVNNETVDIDRVTEFSHQQNSITIHFIGISYQAANDVVYQYRLNDEMDWVETKNSMLNFPLLPPGKYKFQIKAKIRNNPWTEVKSFSFIIHPPFWETWWFIAALIAISFILLVVFLELRKKNRKRKTTEQLKIKTQIAHLEQQALQAMMNPHFIFNVMNTIQHYINNDDGHKANIFLSDFARLIRMNLDLSARSVISLQDEMEYLKLYLSLESMRFGKKFSYDMIVDPEIDDDEIMIPVMIMQPFVENAVLHGIMPMTEPGSLEIKISTLTDDLLKVLIIDNGIGIKQSASGKQENGKHVSRGMSLTQKRIELMSRMTGYNLHIRISDRTIIDNKRGTIVEILLPCNFSDK